ncbi:MAG: penicillin-binding protein 2 [Eubacteriales bacterium]
MKSILKKFFVFLITTTIIATALSGCTISKAVNAFAFLKCIAEKDFENAYTYIWPYSPTYPTEEEFVEEYEDLFDKLSINNVEYKNASIKSDGEDYLLSYTLTYATDHYGDITNDYTICLKSTGFGYYVNFEESVIFPDMESGDTVCVSEIEGSRGEIFSSDGKAIAGNSYAPTVYVDLTVAEDLDAIASELSSILSLDETTILNKMTKAKDSELETVEIYSYLEGQLSDDKISQIEEIKGVAIDTSYLKPIRYYPLHEAAAHIIGYTSSPSEEDMENSIEKGYDPYGLVGKTGIELAFNDALSGSNGTIVYIKDSFGNNKRTIYEKDAKDGEDLYLSINYDMQQYSYALLDNYLSKGQSGVVITLNADTGSLLSAVSYPSFDSMIFNLSVSDETWEALNSDENADPLFSRITQGLYPPGSAIKPFTAAAALEAGAITVDTPFPETETIEDDKWTPSFETWGYPAIKRYEDPGSPTTLTNAMIYSDNIYFAYAMLMLGKDKLVDYLQKAGMDEAIAFDLPVASSSITNENTEINRKLLADMGYGQAEIVMTPLQLAAMYTALLNGGDVLAPKLVEATGGYTEDEYVKTDTSEKNVAFESIMEQSTINTLLPILKKVISEGTGSSANIQGLELAGKTGTAEIGSSKTREISWFIAFETEGTDRLLVLVMIDANPESGKVKFPITKKLFTYYNSNIATEDDDSTTNNDDN